MFVTTGLRMVALCAVATMPFACAPDTGRTASALPACDPDNGGITMPDGFCALVVADLDARARHIAVRGDGDVFVAVYAPPQQTTGGGIVALRDTTGDGRADVTVRFGPEQGGSGIALRGEHLWFGLNEAIVRFTVPAGSLEPVAGPDTIVAGLPGGRVHAAKSIVVTGDGRLFVNIGSPSNACQVADRQPGSTGEDPCPALETRAGIWVFDAERTGQTQADGQRFATGIRNAVALTLGPSATSAVQGDGLSERPQGPARLWVAQHGRDNLAQNWGDMFDEAQSAEKPAEELLIVDEGDDFGWPYCYWDPQLGRKVLAPEYGGDGEAQGRCADIELPAFAFPAHWAPNAITFYAGDQFPARYREGAFIAFHGSWNRAPLPQQGYNVVFLPFNAGAPLANFDVFAEGFAGATMQPGEAAHRPTGLAIGPDGSLYITDDRAGRIWRVLYPGP